MRRSRWFRWGLGLVTAGLIVVLISLLTVYTTWNVVNAYMEELLGPAAVLAGQGADADFVRIVARMAAPRHTVKQAVPEGDGAGAPGGTSPGGPGEAPEEVSKGVREAVPDGAFGDAPGEAYDEAFGAGANEASEAEALEVQARAQLSQEKEAKVLTLEDLLLLRAQWGEEEAAGFLKRLLGRMPPEDVQELARLMEEGLTGSELMEAVRLIEPYLSEEDWETLRPILEP